MADAGYDVWMGNARGTTYSRKHTSLNPDIDEELFWKFSLHEIGTLDVSAMIDYVTKTTKQEKIYYIGHSQGTTVSYVLVSEKPEYNDKLKVIISLAPLAYMQHMSSLLLRLFAMNLMEGVTVNIFTFVFFNLIFFTDCCRTARISLNSRISRKIFSTL